MQRKGKFATIVHVGAFQFAATISPPPLKIFLCEIAVAPPSVAIGLPKAMPVEGMQRLKITDGKAMPCEKLE
jgi:hypothetical protein